jgi:hypothetical protein
MEMESVPYPVGVSNFRAIFWIGARKSGPLAWLLGIVFETTLLGTAQGGQGCVEKNPKISANEIKKSATNQ